MTEENRKGSCALNYCSEHPHIIEKVAKLETSMESVKQSVETHVFSSNQTLRDMRQEINENLTLLRQGISNGVLKRYPAHIMVIITILTATCAALLTAWLGAWKYVAHFEAIMSKLNIL